jgi:signal transduction histidine kinase
VAFSSPKKVRYRYRLEGFDRDWHEAGARREAIYTNLSPSGYRFQVQATNSEAGFGDQDATLDFTLLPTMYQTWWFYGVCSMILILATIAIWRLRLQQLHRQFALVLGERVRVSREIHDTLLQSLVGIALQLDALAEGDEPLHTIKQTIAETRREVEEYIRETRRSIWNLRSPKLDRADLAAALRQTGERATSGLPVQFTLTTTGRAPAFAGDTEQQLLRIGEQAVLNSVRHANASEVHVTLQYDDDAVRMRVQDNGNGFKTDVSNDGAHFGVIGMRERTSQLGGELKIVTSPSGGSAVEVVIPHTN